MRRNNGKLRALLLRLPNHISCLHAAFLCQLVLGQHNPMPFLRTTADRKVRSLQLRMKYALDAGIAIVEVTVEYHSFTHNPASLPHHGVSSTSFLLVPLDSR